MTSTQAWALTFDEAGDTLRVLCSGGWRMLDRLPPAERVVERLGSDSRLRRLVFDTQGVTGWDTGLVAFVVQTESWPGIAPH